jgi:hypothetical protein
MFGVQEERRHDDSLARTLTGNRREGGMTAVRRGIALTPLEVRRDVIVRTATLTDEVGYEIFSLAEGCAWTGPYY